MVETADLTLIIITHIHDNGIRVFQGSVVFYRGKVIAHTIHRVGSIWHTIGHQFIPYFYGQFIKRVAILKGPLNRHVIQFPHPVHLR